MPLFARLRVHGEGPNTSLEPAARLTLLVHLSSKLRQAPRCLLSTSLLVVAVAVALGIPWRARPAAGRRGAIESNFEKDGLRGLVRRLRSP